MRRMSKRQVGDLVGPAPVPAETLVLLNRATVQMQLLPAAIHDLNNALFLTSGSTELLAARPDLAPEVRAKLERIAAQTERATGVLRQLATLVTRDAEPVQPQPLKLGRILDDCLAACRTRHRKSGTAVTLDVPPPDDLPSVVADPGELRQIVFNLLLNAEQGAGAGRAIEIRLGARDQTVQLEVIDSGSSPLPPDPFALFVTGGDPARAAGIGLTVARLLASRSGGRIEHRPTSDRRTRFVLSLPAVS
jgi:signal transduction histidine kinase